MKEKKTFANKEEAVYQVKIKIMSSPTNTSIP